MKSEWQNSFRILICLLVLRIFTFDIYHSTCFNKFEGLSGSVLLLKFWIDIAAFSFRLLSFALVSKWGGGGGAMSVSDVLSCKASINKHYRLCTYNGNCEH